MTTNTSAPGGQDRPEVARSEETASFSADTDELSQCLRFVLGFYDLRPDLDSLKKVLPRSGDKWSLDDLPLLAERLKLELHQTEGSLSEVASAPSPVLVMRSDHAPEVYLPSSTGREGIFRAGEGVTSQPLVDLQDEQVDLILLKPSEHDVEAKLDHMDRERPIDWFFAPLKAHRISFVEVLVCSLFINLFVLLIPLFTLNVYDQVIPNFAQETLVVLTVGVLIALVFDFLLKTVRTYVLERVAARVGSDFDGKLMERMLSINHERMTLSIGERANLFRELQGIREFYAAKLIPTSVDLPFFLLFIGVIYLIAPALAIVPVVGAVVIVGLNAAIQIPINRATKSYFASMQKKSTVLLETLHGTVTFKLFNALGSRLFRWSTVADQAAQTSRYTQFLLGLVQNMSLSAVHIVHVLVVVVGVYQIQAGLLTIGGLIACTILSGRAIAPIVNVGAVVSRWQQSKDVLVAIDALFQLPHEGERALAQTAEGDFEGAVTMRGVTYRYPGQSQPALDQVNVEIQPGERVALIGPSGAGKSTFANLLTGLLQGFDGDIQFDGYQVASIAPAKLRDNVAFVPQLPHFVTGTIRDNVLLGCDDVSDEMLAQALEISGLASVIKQTGYGLDTPVGENASFLSGGQRQAVSLARALVRDPKIIVFDEPSTGLDATLEAQLKQKLVPYLEGRTFIMVTHRSSMLDVVERLILLDAGRVKIDGTRQEVMRRLTAGDQSVVRH